MIADRCRIANRVPTESHCRFTVIPSIVDISRPASERHVLQKSHVTLYIDVGRKYRDTNVRRDVRASRKFVNLETVTSTRSSYTTSRKELAIAEGHLFFLFFFLLSRDAKSVRESKKPRFRRLRFSCNGLKSVRYRRHV